MLGFEEGSKREWEVLRNSNRSGNWESVDRELEEGGVGGDSVAERGEGGVHCRRSTIDLISRFP